ncbi:MAG TPA: hypothetical protein PKI11_07660 [Candidatus Hydrogenedentes bacterium]|nr:hypothetical protein [Candidatus Hydrogenedentota bacterium]
MPTHTKRCSGRFPACRAETSREGPTAGLFTVLSAFVILLSAPCAHADATLVGHWRLLGDITDISGREAHAVNHGVTLTPEGAVFDSKDACIEVLPDKIGLPATGEFSVSVWVRGADRDGECFGDVVSLFDITERKGFSLAVQTRRGVTSAQTNWENPFFGVNNGAPETPWTDCGRPGDNNMVWALCVYAGALYAGTFETGKDQTGHVYRYEGGTAWADCGAPHPSNAITALAVHDGSLYAAASHYRAGGSALAESENLVPGGRVFRYEGGAAWTDCGGLGDSEAVGGMAVFNRRLYATSMYSPAGMYRYAGDAVWESCGDPGYRVEALSVFQDALYAAGWDAERPGIFRYDGTAWAYCGTPPDIHQSYSFATYAGRLYVGTWPNAAIYRYGGGNLWEDCGRLAEEEREVMAMAAYNGALYAGSLPLAAVYRYEPSNRWASTGRLDLTPDVKYRRVWSMAVYQGKLFAGTLPSGRVYAMEAGKCVTHDHALAPGWNHLIAVREREHIRLHVNGALAAEAACPADRYPLPENTSLRIGRGPHDAFHGAMRDLRIYNRALTDAETRDLAAVRPE